MAVWEFSSTCNRECRCAGEGHNSRNARVLSRITQPHINCYKKTIHLHTHTLLSEATKWNTFSCTSAWKYLRLTLPPKHIKCSTGCFSSPPASSLSHCEYFKGKSAFEYSEWVSPEAMTAPLQSSQTALTLLQTRFYVINFNLAHI